MDTLLPRWPLPAVADTLRDLELAAGALPDDELMAELASGFADAQHRLEAWEADVDWCAAAIRDGFLAIRRPLPFFNQAFGVLPPDPAGGDPLDFAARLVAAAAAYALEAEAGQVPTETERGEPLEMGQYQRSLFGNVRLPLPGRDRRVRHPGSTHVAVLVAGRTFRLDVLVDGRPAAGTAIRQALGELVAAAPALEPAPCLGTSLDREAWAVLRARLEAEPTNRAAFADVDRALFVLALDLDEAPADFPAIAELVRVGPLENRWFDKSFQMIVPATGWLAANGEHSAIDGHSTFNFFRQIWQTAVARQDQTGPAASWRPIAWRLDPAAREQLEAGHEAARVEAARRRHAVVEIDSPEGFPGGESLVHLAIQVAAREALGGLPAIAQSVQNRRFRHGRYAPVLAVTPEARVLVDAARTGASAAALAAPLAAAIRAHREQIKACKLGYAPLLHLAALVMLDPAAGATLAARAPHVAALLACPISTSSMPATPEFVLCGFTDAEPDVLGIAFILDARRVTIDLKADGTQAARLDAFVAALRDALPRLIAAGASLPIRAAGPPSSSPVAKPPPVPEGFLGNAQGSLSRF